MIGPGKYNCILIYNFQVNFCIDLNILRNTIQLQQLQITSFFRDISKFKKKNSFPVLTVFLQILYNCGEFLKKSVVDNALLI